jgi:hypothetical protein
MDLLVGAIPALLVGLPWAVLMLSQPTADVSGYLNSAPPRDSATGSVREVGTSGAPLTGVPTSSTTGEEA